VSNLRSLFCVPLSVSAAHEFDARRRMISKNFHHVLRVSERQPLVGPPESMREHVVAACKAMKVGNWRACYNYIINDKMNAKVFALSVSVRVLSFLSLHCPMSHTTSQTTGTQELPCCGLRSW